MSEAETWPKFWGEVNNTSTFDGFAYPKRFYKAPSEREGLVIGTQQNALELIRALLAPWPGRTAKITKKTTRFC